MTHTPGPWNYGNAKRGVIMVGSTDLPVAAAYQTSAIPNGEANARLIAAAPELLEALRAMRDAVNERNLVELGKAADKADTVIAKATQ